MPNIPPELLNILIQSGFAGLFIWLLFRTQQRQDLREDKLMGLLQAHADTLPKIVEALKVLPDISKGITDMTRVIGALEHRMEEIEKNQRGK